MEARSPKSNRFPSGRSRGSLEAFRGALGVISDLDRFFGVEYSVVLDREGSLEKSTDLESPGSEKSLLLLKRSDMDERRFELDLRRFGVLWGSKSGEKPHNFGEPIGDKPSNDASRSLSSARERLGVAGEGPLFESNCDGMSTNIYGEGIR
jgi:hypothetical protein